MSTAPENTVVANENADDNKDKRTFRIIEEFIGLSTRRRLLLCEQLYLEGPDYFRGTVGLLWPQATNKDVKKLEKFLYVLRETHAATGTTANLSLAS
jgi:hypothetical protein